MKNIEKKGARVEKLDTRSLRSACVQTSQIEFFDRLPEGAELPRELNPVAIHHLPDALRLDYLDAFGSAIHAVFMLAAGIMVLAFVLSWFLREAPLRRQA